MADERDPKLSQRYRELERLEPPPALDQKILAAARAATESHAPLVVPAGRHRWYYSLAAAAVLVFAVALTLHLDRDRPDADAMYSPTVRGEIKHAQPKVEPVPPAEPVAKAEPQRAPAFTPDPQASAPRVAEVARAPAPSPRADESRAQLSEKMAIAKQQGAASRAMASGAPTPAPAATPPENPERWLERIAEMRSRGRHAEADKELTEFRRVYPNYSLSEVMRERVEGK